MALHHVQPNSKSFVQQFSVILLKGLLELGNIEQPKWVNFEAYAKQTGETHFQKFKIVASKKTTILARK